MRKPYCIKEDEEERTLQDLVEQIALGVATNVVNGERTEVIQSNCKILNSLTEALKAVKN